MGFALPRAQSSTPLLELPLPPRVYLACGQQAGPEAEPVVQVGQQVACGEVVALREDGLALHASIAGTVLEKQRQRLANGRRSTVLVVERDEPNTSPVRLLPGSDADWQHLPAPDLLERLTRAGIVGMGGAAFPSAIKAAAALNRPCHHIILNGSECEPQMNCDRVLLRHEPERVIDGLMLLQRICRAQRTAIALLKRESAVGKSLQECARTRGLKLEVHLLPNRYSMGSEKILLRACLGLEIPEKKLPIDIGALVFNVSTSAAVADAILRRIPLVSRIVTVAGPSWQCSLRVQIGTRLDFILSHLHINIEEVRRIIVGGPMMGAAFQNFQHPVLKGSTGFYLLTRKELRPRAQRGCLHCGACLPACPVNLQPALLFHLLASDQRDEAVRQGLPSCIECGACTAVCPSGIPLAHSFRSGKLRVRQEQSRG